MELKKLLINGLIVGVSILLGGCELEKKTHTEVRTKIHEYKTRNSDGDWIYWYVVFGNNNSYYSYNSLFPIYEFSTVPFSESPSIPSELNNVFEEKFEEIPTEVLPDQIEAEVQTENVETFNENFDSNDGWGDSHNSSDNASEGSSESGSSDGGSSDGGSSGGDGGSSGE